MGGSLETPSLSCCPRGTSNHILLPMSSTRALSAPSSACAPVAFHLKALRSKETPEISPQNDLFSPFPWAGKGHRVTRPLNPVNRFYRHI